MFLPCLYAPIDSLCECRGLCVRQEEQVRKVRSGNQERYQQLETSIQEKLAQAEERRLQREAGQREKLRNHVSDPFTIETPDETSQ